MGKSPEASHPRFLTLSGSFAFFLLWVGVMAAGDDAPIAWHMLAWTPSLLPTMLEKAYFSRFHLPALDHQWPTTWILWTVADSTYSQGLQGTHDTASKAALENEFGTSVDDEVIKQILEKGETQTSEVSTIHPRLVATATGS